MSREAIIAQYPLTATEAKLSTLLGMPDAALLSGTLTVPATHQHAVQIKSTGTKNATVLVWKFTISSGSASKGATYTDSNGLTITIDATVSSSTTVYGHSALGTTPAAGGEGVKLTRTSAESTGDAELTYSAVAASAIADNPQTVAGTVAWTMGPTTFEAGSVTVKATTPDATDVIQIQATKG